ncbi:MAG: cell division protein SepF [Clostridiales bacterium]|jgi:cell division inhibitor SepF|nr:cell division protein SepF [Clostridiales bacterium]
MAGLLNTLKNWVGFEDYEDDYEQDFINNSAQDEPAYPRGNPEMHEPRYQNDIEYFGSRKRGGSKVVNINTTARLNVVIINPETFEEARDVADHIKSKKPCIVNLEKVEKEVARRIVDFLSGAVYAIDGNIQRVSHGIFMVAPYNVSITGDFKDELRSKAFPWI